VRVHQFVVLGIVVCLSGVGAAACSRSSPAAPPLTLAGRSYALNYADPAGYVGPALLLPASWCVPGYDSARITSGSIQFGADTAIELVSYDKWRANTKTSIQDRYPRLYTVLPSGAFTFTYYVFSYSSLTSVANQSTLDTASTQLAIEHDNGSAVTSCSDYYFSYSRTR
jgi:hypothetical protein